MAGRQQRGPQEHHSWKQPRRNTARSPKTPRRSMRWSLSAIALLLLAAFVYLVWPLLFDHTIHTHMVALAVGNYEKLAYPPIPWNDDDLQDPALKAATHPQSTHLSYHDNSDKFRNAGRDLLTFDDNTAHQRDCMVLYIAAHAVPNATRDGVDLLLLHNKRYAIADIIAQVKQRREGLKLLVLDCGRLSSDWLHGWVTNNFPELLASELSSMATDANDEIWILASHAGYQADVGWYGTKRTLFGGAVMDGITGAADRDGNYFVELHELHDYVVQRCRNESGGRQTPMLLRVGRAPGITTIPQVPVAMLAQVASPSETAGEGNSQTDGEVPKDAGGTVAPASEETAKHSPAERDASATVYLTSAAVPQTTDNPAPAQAAPAQAAPAQAAPAAGGATEAPTAAANQTPPTSGNPPAAEPAATAATPAEPSTSPAQPAAPQPAGEKTPSPAARFTALLDRAWELRDQIENSVSGVRWSPAEYMPHLWRELNLWLLSYELGQEAAIGGSPGEVDKQLRELTQFVVGMEELAGDAQVDPASTASESLLFLSRLQRWQAWRQTQDFADYAPESPELRHVASMVRDVRRVEYSIHDFVRWHGQAMWLFPEPSNAMAKLSGAIDATLEASKNFERRYDESANQVFQKHEYETWIDLHKNVMQSHRSLIDAWRDWITSLIKPRFGNDKPQSLDYVYGEMFMAAPMLTSDQRIAIREWLKQRPVRDYRANQWDSREWNDVEPSRVDGGMSDFVKSQLAKQVVWNRLLAEVAVGELAQQVQVPWASETLVVQEPAALGMKYAELHQMVLKQLTDETVSQADTMKRLQWIDGRSDLSKTPWAKPVFAIRAPLEKKYRWAETNPTQVIVGDKWEPLELTFITNQNAASPLKVTLARCDAMIEVNVLGKNGEQRWELGQAIPFIVGTDGETVGIPLRARSTIPNDSLAARQEGIVELRVDQGPTYSVICKPAAPNRIALWIDHQTEEGVRELLPTRSNAFELPSFPNRENNYRLRVENLTDQPERQLRVRLVTWARPVGFAAPPGRVLGRNNDVLPGILRHVEVSGELARGVKVIAESNGAVRAPQGTRVPVDFSKAPPAADAPAAATTPPADPAAPAQRVDYGLACVITDESDSSLREVYWIGWKIVPPHRYIELDSRLQDTELVVSAEWLAGADRPKLAADDSVLLAWDMTVIPDQLFRQRSPSARLTASDQVARMSGIFNGTDNRGSVAVWVDADGCPRAFKHQIDLRGLEEGKDLRASTTFSRITLVALPNALRFYKYPRTPDPQVAEGQVPYVAELHDQRRIYFKSSDQEQKLVVKFQVDAPDTQFGPEDAQDVIEVGLRDLAVSAAGGLGAREKFYRDRQQEIDFVEAGADGLVRTRSRFTDYEIQLPVPAGTAEFHELFLDMVVGGVEEHVKYEVLFDADPPVITAIRPTTRPLLFDQPFQVRVAAEDASEVVKVEVGIAESPDDVVAKPVTDTKAPFEFELVAPPGPKTTYYLLVKATDAVGQTTEKAEKIAFRKPTPPATEPAPGDIKGTIKGRVLAGPGKLPLTKCEVMISGTKSGKVTTDGNGHFEFKDFPVGTYKLEVKGHRLPSIGPQDGEEEIVIEELKDFAKEWDIKTPG